MYKIFWQKHYLFTPPAGIHTNLSGAELSYYSQQVKYGLIDHPSGNGNPGGGRVFCGLEIWDDETTDNGQWNIRSHGQKHWFGVPKQLLAPNNQLELSNWI